MLTVPYGTLRSESFRNAIVKLGTCPDLGMDTSLKVLEISKKLELKLRESQGEWVTMLKQYVPVEKGTNFFALNKEKTDFAWKDGVDPEEAKRKIMEFTSKEVTVDHEPLDIKDLTPVKLSAIDIAVLDPLLKK
jgi:hypothetical protein